MFVYSQTARRLPGLLLALALPAAAAGQAVYPGMKSGVVKILADKPELGRDVGAGLVVGVDGNVALILTANHVIEDASQIVVKFFDKPYVGFDAVAFEKFHQDLDVAVLVVAPDEGRRIPAGLPAFDVGDGAGLAELDKISAIGHPLDVEWQISLATIAQIGHEDDLRKFRFTKGDVAPGSSGGPVFDDGGKVIGMVIEAAPLHGIGVRIDAILPLLESWRIATSQLVPRRVVGTLLVRSEPPGAEVFLDSHPVGTTAGGTLVLRQLSPGPHRLRATFADHGAWEQTVYVEADREVPVEAVLESAVGSLRVETRPPGATIALAGRVVGSTDSGPLTLEGLDAGQYVLSVTREGFEALHTQVEVSAARVANVLAELRSIEEEPVEAHLVLYKNGNLKGPSLTIRLGSGGRVDIRKGHPLFRSAAAGELFAPSNVEVMLAQHPLSSKRYPGSTGTWRGNGDRVRIDKRDLERLKLKNAVASVTWYVDGKTPEGRRAVVP